MSNKVAKEVLRNAIWIAAESIELHELHTLFREEIRKLREFVIKKNNEKIKIMQEDDGEYDLAEEKEAESEEKDWKRIDDAQRYRDLKNG